MNFKSLKLIKNRVREIYQNKNSYLFLKFRSQTILFYYYIRILLFYKFDIIFTFGKLLEKILEVRDQPDSLNYHNVSFSN